MSTGLAKLVSSVAHRHKFSLVECSLEKSSTNNGFISVNKLLLYYTNPVNVLDRHGSFNVRLLNDYFLSVNGHHTMQTTVPSSNHYIRITRSSLFTSCSRPPRSVKGRIIQLESSNLKAQKTKWLSFHV